MDNNTLAIYIHELRNQCLHMQASFDLFNQALQGGQSMGVLYAGQMALIPASQLASILWPARARARGRGESLRKVLGLEEKHPLNDRRLGELWEHADTKLEEWIATTRGEKIIFDFVGNPASLNDNGAQVPEANMYRVYDPESHIYYYRGVGYNLQAVANAIADVGGRVNAVYRQMFPEQAEAEARAQQSAAAEAEKAAKSAE